MLLRPIKETGALLLKLIRVAGMIKSLLLTGNRARVVWPLLKVVKEKKHRYPTKADLL